MARLGLERNVIDKDVLDRTITRLRQDGVLLPTLRQLEDPTTIPAAIRAELADVDPDTAHPLNLFRVHWFNTADRRGVRRRARLRGAAARDHRRRGPHRAGIGQPLSHDPRPQGARRLWLPGAAPRHWPVRSRPPQGGVAVDRKLLPRRCRHLAHPRLPRRRRAAGEHEPASASTGSTNGSRTPSDVIRTPGSESNVKEIYDCCAASTGCPRTSSSISSANSGTIWCTASAPEPRWRRSSNA